MRRFPALAAISLFAAACGSTSAAKPPPPAAPAAPASLTATAAGTTITLAWPAVDTATGYLVLRGTATGGPYTQLATPAAPGYADSGLSPSTAYYYVVEATNAAGKSGNSPEASATTPAAVPPAAPASLTATASGSTITLSWPAVSGATSYVVLRGTAAGGPYTQLATPASPGYADGSASPGTAYYYVVQAKGPTGTSGNSPEASATIAALPPAAPTALTATGGKGKVTLAWTASAGATSYKISRGSAAGTHAPLGTSTTPGFVDATAPAGVTSYYVVFATNSAGDSGASGEASALTAPPPPTALHASAITQTGLTLGWTASTGAATYLVSRGTAPGAEVAGTPGTALSQTDTGLAPGTTYYYVVTATNASGTSDPSGEFSVITVPADPALLTASAGNGLVQLSWPAVAGAAAYDVLQSNAPGGPYTPSSGSFGPTGLTYTATAANGTTLYFVIDARNASGTSADSNEVSATPQSGLPAAPLLTAATAGNGQVSLSWNSSAPGFKVFRGTVSGNENLLTTLSSTTYLDTSVSNGVTYYYYVIAHNAAGDSPPSNEKSATPTAPLGAATLSAVAVNNAVKLSWTAVAGATSYNVYSGSSAGSESATALASVSTNSYLDSTAVNHVAVYYIVKAVNASSTGPASNEVSATPAREVCIATDGPSILAVDTEGSGERDPRRFFGSATGLLGPTGVAVDASATSLEIATSNYQGWSVTVHSLSASGNARPLRTISGISNPRGLAFDNGKIFIANDVGPTGRVTVFAHDASGDPPPLNSFNTSAAAKQLVAVHSRAEVMIGEPGSITVYNQTDSGTPAPKRTLTPTSGSEQITALAYDPGADELYVGIDRDATNSSSLTRIAVYPGTAQNGAGGVAPNPTRTLTVSTGGFASSSSLLFDPVSKEIVQSSGATLYVYDALQTSGNASPKRSITTGYQGHVLAYDAANSKYRFGTGVGSQFSVLAAVPRTSSGAVGPTDVVSTRIDSASDVPAWLVADPGRDELWFNSLSTNNFVGVFGRTAAIINDLPLRQFGGNSAVADYTAIALDAADAEVYIVSTSAQTVTAFSATAATDKDALHTIGATLNLPTSQLPANAVFDAVHHELVLSLTDSTTGAGSIGFYTRTGPGTFNSTPRLLITSSTLSTPTSLAVDSTSVYVVNGDNTVQRFDSSGTGTVNKTALATLTQQVADLKSVNGVGALLLDGGELYVANSRNSSRFQVSIYTLASFAGPTPVAPSRTIEVRGAGANAQGLAFCN